MEKVVGNNGRKGAAMIKWAEHLYVDEGITAKKEKKLKRAIENGRLTFEVYCITFATNPNNLFDIMNANELLFPYYKKREMYVLGIASSREDAIYLVKDLIEEIYTQTGGFKVREYF